ncbi:MAG: SCO family protein [Parvularculaceae bacterium]
MTALKARAALLSCAILSLGACGDGAPGARTPSPGVIELSEQFSADFALVDQDGKVMRDEDLNGRAAIVYFGFASCPDVCPLALGRLSAALNELTPAELERLEPLFITVDPDRDTVDALKRYLAFDTRITGLTGDRVAVEAAKAGFKVFAEPEPVEDSKLGYTMQHSSLFYLVEPDGALRYALEDTLDPAALAAEIRKALKRKR